MSKFKRSDPPLCACGCGESVKWSKKENKWRKYINGHQNRGRRITEETKRKISIANTGRRFTEEVRKKVSIAKMGKNNPMYGRKHSKKWCMAQSEKMKAKGTSHPAKRPEVRKKISEAQKRLGQNHHKKTLEARKLQSEKMLALGENNPMKRPEIAIQFMGDNSSNWKGGIATDPYCGVWSDTDFKESIKERDEHVCQNPDCWGKCGHVPLNIHHIDFDKKNCHPQNLITVCASCNSRANINRTYWTIFYQAILSEKYGYVYNP